MATDERPAQLSLDATPDHSAHGFRGPEVCRIAGISYRQLDYWTRTGLVRSSIAEARGSGTQRVYSYRDLVEVRLIKRLLDVGVSLQKARDAVEYLRDHLGEDLASANLVIGEGGLILARTGEELVDVLRRGQVVFNVVALDGLMEELEAKIHELRPREAAVVPTAAATEPRGHRGAGG